MDAKECTYMLWLKYMIESHPEGYLWLIPHFVDPGAFRKVTRALYLAGYGSEEAMDLLDELFPWPARGCCRVVYRIFDVQFAGTPIPAGCEETTVTVAKGF